MFEHNARSTDRLVAKSSRQVKVSAVQAICSHDHEHQHEPALLRSFEAYTNHCDCTAQGPLPTHEHSLSHYIVTDIAYIENLCAGAQYDREAMVVSQIHR